LGKLLVYLGKDLQSKDDVKLTSLSVILDSRLRRKTFKSYFRLTIELLN